MNVTEGTRESHYITPPRRRRDCHFPEMAHRRLLLALTVGLIARCVAGGGIGLEESRAADLEPGGDAHPRVPMSTPACVACERVAREIADAAARIWKAESVAADGRNVEGGCARFCLGGMALASTGSVRASQSGSAGPGRASAGEGPPQL